LNSDSNVRSVTRVMSILDQFTLERPELNLTEISAGTGLSMSTAHRLLSTLESTEMVEFDKKSGHYMLGLRAFRLGSVASKSMELLKQADPLLLELAEETSENYFLLVADGNETLCLRRFAGALHSRRVPITEAGRHSVFNCGAAQRMLLAHLPDWRWEEIVAHHTRRLTQYSLVGRDELDRDRREIRLRGYSMSWEDMIMHDCALGAPVRNSSGMVIAAVSVGGSVLRFTADRLPALIRTILEVGGELSRRIGYEP